MLAPSQAEKGRASAALVANMACSFPSLWLRMKLRAYKFGSAMKRTLFAASLLFTAGSFAQSPPAPMVSPEVHRDHRGTFRFRAPNATSVALAKQTYPVLSLLDGFSDDASGWTAVGRANVVLDNVIAQGKAKPMLVVMPLGYGAPEILKLGFGAFRNAEVRDRNFSKFREALLTEVLPRVESAYLVARDRDSRAIAGLSMAGSESLLTGLNTLDQFAWIGAFSSGGLPEDFEKDFPALDSRADQQLRLLWIACGTDDRLIDLNRKLRGWLASKGVRHVDIETPGAHTWMVWRRNLTAFTSLLFR